MRRTPYRKVVKARDKVLTVEYVKPGYTCIRDDTMEMFDKLSRTLKDLRDTLKAISRRLNDVISHIRVKLHHAHRV